MIGKIFYFIIHIHTFVKFYITNKRCAKYNYRRFKFKLYLTVKDKDDNIIDMKLMHKNIIIKANYNDTEKLISIPVPDYILPTPEAHEEYRRYQLPFIILRDEHHDIFKLCDHLTFKEII